MRLEIRNMKNELCRMKNEFIIINTQLDIKENNIVVLLRLNPSEKVKQSKTIVPSFDIIRNISK